ncbi:hypothetical protein PF010_g14639 [Phytophthora fragariae]|uniref:Uncharacterized protein n=1 Tax=Phytophthora fragariae TaxID=53985 RepID=A0A6G0KX45_9STRA|nr:hypothetical protein PF010_g14639 [Phytophthora fragariae]
MGTIMAGAVIAGVYVTSTPEACQYISAHCDAKLPKLKALVVWNDDDIPQGAKYKVPVYSFNDFLGLSENVDVSLLDKRMHAQLPSHCCTLIYTSGFQRCKAVRELLALSHVAAQILDIHLPLAIGSEVYFACPDALRGGLLGTLQEVRPNFFFGVSRVWEKMMESLKEKLGGAPEGLKKSLLTWAMTLGADYANQSQFGADSGANLSFWAADYLLLSKVRSALGLDECSIFLTGAAPIAPDVIR